MGTRWAKVGNSSEGFSPTRWVGLSGVTSSGNCTSWRRRARRCSTSLFIDPPPYPSPRRGRETLQHGSLRDFIDPPPYPSDTSECSTAGLGCANSDAFRCIAPRRGRGTLQHDSLRVFIDPLLYPHLPSPVPGRLRPGAPLPRPGRRGPTRASASRPGTEIGRAHV